MDSAHQRMLNIWESATTARREKTMLELDQWLSCLPSSWGKSLLTCTPTDVIIFMERSWLAKHGGTVLPDGSIVASPSGVNSCLSSLSTGFSLLGRGGGWSPVTPHGNPMHSAVLVHWRKGYKLQSWRRGCQETSAVPMTSNKAFELVDYIDSVAAASSNVMEVLLCQRDALIVLLMWESCLRGVDCGKLRVEDFFTLEGSSAHLTLPELILIASQIIIRPNGSKLSKGAGQEQSPWSRQIMRLIAACPG